MNNRLIATSQVRPSFLCVCGQVDDVEGLYSIKTIRRDVLLQAAAEGSFNSSPSTLLLLLLLLSLSLPADTADTFTRLKRLDRIKKKKKKKLENISFSSF